MIRAMKLLSDIAKDALELPPAQRLTLAREKLRASVQGARSPFPIVIVQILREAERELNAAVAYYEDLEPGLGLRLK